MFIYKAETYKLQNYSNSQHLVLGILQFKKSIHVFLNITESHTCSELWKANLCFNSLFVYNIFVQNVKLFAKNLSSHENLVIYLILNFFFLCFNTQNVNLHGFNTKLKCKKTVKDDLKIRYKHLKRLLLSNKTSN